MDPIPHLLILGASIRAAAFSALRAGLMPWGADLFGDADLIARCSCTRLPAPAYPRGGFRLAKQGPPGPWMYTGALENQPTLIRKLTQLRLLWGNSGEVVHRVRSPLTVEAWLRNCGLPCPRHLRDASRLPSDGRWLVKPLAGAGGRGIVYWSSALPTHPAGKVYIQEYIQGEPCAAVYVGAGSQAILLGVTRQLIGEPWLNALSFHYCGSVGPLAMDNTTRTAFQRLGQALMDGFQLRGLFGVDCVLQSGTPYPVEINPRYTASVEILEYATGVGALALHRDAFAADKVVATQLHQSTSKIAGKAILFAKQPIVFPVRGPWMQAFDAISSIHELPAFADIPHAGERIGPGQPILTLFHQADSVAACVNQLQQIAQDLDHWLQRH